MNKLSNAQYLYEPLNKKISFVIECTPMKEQTAVKKSGIDILSGPIGSALLKFALPLAATGILQQLFNAADVAVVGRFVGKNAMAAVGSNSPIIGLIVNLFLGISLGANVVIANLTGRKDREGISRATHTSIVTAVISTPLKKFI